MDNLHEAEIDFETSPDVFPLLRPGGVLKTITLDDGTVKDIPKEGRPVTFQVVADKVSVVLGRDLKVSFQRIRNNQLEGQDLGNIVSNAYQNVFRIHPNMGKALIQSREHPNIGKVGCITDAGGYAGCLVLVENVWNDIFTLLDSEEVVFIIPSPDTFVFCASDNNSGISYLRTFAMSKMKDTPRPISSDLFMKSRGAIIQDFAP